MATGPAETLRTLHAAAVEIGESETIEAACERTVAAAEATLEFEMCSVILHEDDWLVPVALSSGAPEDGARRMRLDQGLAGQTFQSGESEIVDRVQPEDDTDPAKEFYRSGMSVPIGDVGVFQAVSGETGAFDERDIEFVELLVAHTASAVERVRFERELQERKEKLQRQNERLEEFVSVVGHDLRNPLETMSGHLELARETGDEEHLDWCRTAVERMDTLIDDLLDLARAGADIGETEAVDLARLARECWWVVDSSDATVTVETERTVVADRSRLRQLFENLMRNAVEHAGPEVTVTVGDIENGFYLEDDGPGIPAEARDRVFGSGFSTVEDGTGFGLKIVEQVAGAHGWSIRLVEGPDGGARFEITGVEFATE